MMETKQQTDATLVQNYLSGDRSSLNDLVIRHREYVYAFIMSKVRNRDVANDIFQDVFIKVMRSFDSGAYNEKGKFLSWVFLITRNVIMDHFRKEKKFSEIGHNDQHDVFMFFENTEKTIEDVIIQENSFDGLRKLIKALPKEQREVLVMRFWKDMSFKEIAEATDVSISTGLGRMRYAIRNIRKMMTQENITLLNQIK